MKESQRRSLFLLSFLQEGEETVKGSSIDQIFVRGLVVKCEKRHRIFSTFPKIIFYLSNKRISRSENVYIFRR